MYKVYARSCESDGKNFYTVPKSLQSKVKAQIEGNKYILDPHGACGYMALKAGLQEGETGVFGETAHPAKFKETVENAIGNTIEIPARLAAFMKGEKKTVSLSKNFDDFKNFLMNV